MVMSAAKLNYLTSAGFSSNSICNNLCSLYTYSSYFLCDGRSSGDRVPLRHDSSFPWVNDTFCKNEALQVIKAILNGNHTAVRWTLHTGK